jgi:hypothetical protein
MMAKTAASSYCGISSDETCLRRSGIRHERWPELAMRRLNGTWEPEIPMLTEKPQVEEPRGREYGCGISGAEQLVVAMKPWIKGWSEGAVQWSQIRRSTRRGRNR